MERDSQEQRAYADSWPPGFFTGSVLLRTRTRSRQRDWLTTVCLAVCAYCLGFGLTDWACDASDKAARAAALSRSRIAAPTGVRAATPLAEPIATEPALVAEDPASVREVPSPQLKKHPKPVRKAAAPRNEPIALSEAAPDPLATEEPTPRVTVEEVNQVLALADASQRIFASVDEASPKPVIVRPPPAAVAHQGEAARTATVVAIEGLTVAGALSSRVVSRGLQRLMPQYDRCRDYSDNAPQRLKLSTTIDELGRGRRVTVEGPLRTDLRRCLELATAHLVVPAPDTGTARAQWIVRFAAR